MTKQQQADLFARYVLRADTLLQALGHAGTGFAGLVPYYKLCVETKAIAENYYAVHAGWQS